MRPLWSDLKPSTHPFAPERLGAPLPTLLSSFGVVADPSWRSAAVEDIDRLVKAESGGWAWGWRDYGGDDHMIIQGWCCPTHLLFPEGYASERVAENATRIMATLMEWRAYLERLEGLYGEALVADDSVEGRLAITGMIARLALVIEVTRCSDAWYSCAIDAVSWFLQHLGIPPTRPTPLRRAASRVGSKAGSSPTRRRASARSATPRVLPMISGSASGRRRARERSARSAQSGARRACRGASPRRRCGSVWRRSGRVHPRPIPILISPISTTTTALAILVAPRR